MFLLILLPLVAQAQHFFGPPAVGFGVGMVSVYSQRFPLASSIVSRRMSRTYSHQSFWRPTTIAWGVTGGPTRYRRQNHYQIASNLAYYQPNVYHYHSTPWRYRWGRSTDMEARVRREAKLAEVGDLNTIPVTKISNVASNISVAYKKDIWENDMVFKDQDDCSKRLICELNAKGAEGRELTANEELIAQIFGKGNSLDVSKESLEFDVAAVLGRKIGKLRCELSYRRCTVSVEELMDMIETEISEVEDIEKEIGNGVISVEDLKNRLDEEEEEVAALSVDDLTTIKQRGYYPGSAKLLASEGQRIVLSTHPLQL